MNERADLDKMTGDELVAYYNILTMATRMIQVDPDGKTKRHLGIVCDLLTERGVAYEPRKLLKRG